MPKSRKHKGMSPLPGGGHRVLEHYGLQGNPIAQARAGDRRLRAVAERRPDLFVRIGGRLYILDEPRVLEALAAELGVLLPPVAALSSSTKAAA